MTEQNKPKALADEDLNDVQGGDKTRPVGRSTPLLSRALVDNEETRTHTASFGTVAGGDPNV